MPRFRSIDLMRDREIIKTAREDASRWLGTTAGAPAEMTKLLESWDVRFKLIEVG